MGGPYDLSVSPSPFGLDFGTLHLTILAWFGLIKLWLCLFYRILAFLNTKVSSIVKSTVFAVKAMLPGRAGPCVSVTTHPHLLSWGLSLGGERDTRNVLTTLRFRANVNCMIYYQAWAQIRIKPQVLKIRAIAQFQFTE